jgi:hypothetical protein
MYIVAKVFKDDCVERQINYKDTMKQLQTKGIYQGSTTRRMTSGTKIKGTPVHVMQFDCSAPEFINVDEYVGVEKADEGSGSSVSN